MWFFSQFFSKNVITSPKFEYFKAVPVFSMIIRSHPCIFRFSPIFFQLSLLAEHCVTEILKKEFLLKEKIALKRKIHGSDRMVIANTESALKYLNLVEVITFLAKIWLENTFWAFYYCYCQNLSKNMTKKSINKSFKKICQKICPKNLSCDFNSGVESC